MDNPSKPKVFFRGVTAMLAALAFLYLVATIFPVVAYPPERLAAVVRDLVPGDIVTGAIEQGVSLANRLGWKFLEHAALMALAATVHAGALGAGGLSSLIIDRAATTAARAKRAIITASGFSAIACLLAITAPEGLPALSVLSYLVAGYIFARLSTNTSLSVFLEPDIKDGETPLDSIRRSRRRFLRRGAGAVGAVLTGGIVLRQFGRGSPNTDVRIVEPDERFKRPPDDLIVPVVSGQTAEITANKDFYNVDINISKPVVDHQTWKLNIHGLVDRPMQLTFRQLQTQFSIVEMASTLTCISNEVGGGLVSTAVWRGVRLKDLLQRAGVKATTTELVFTGVEGYTDSISLEKAMEDSTLVAFGMNGQALPVANGFPARIIVPGIYGMKNVKWLTEIEATGSDYRGYWQTRGWSDSAPVKTQSRIDVPKEGSRVTSPAQLAGVAWAGDREISLVEVSSDNGRTWRPARLRRALSPRSWRLWSADVEPGEGKRNFLVRATDGNGAIQQRRQTRTHPNGASGLDSVRFTVRDEKTNG